MANSDKKILITPNKGQNENPNIIFTGGDNIDTSLEVSTDSSRPSLIISSANSGYLHIGANNSTVIGAGDTTSVPSFEITSDGGSTLGKTGLEASKPISIPKHETLSLPSYAEEGSIIYDKDAKVPKVFNGTYWDDCAEPAIVTRGLKLFLDPRHYKPNRSLLKTTHWNTGSGSYSESNRELGEHAFNQNGGTSENERIRVSDGPFRSDAMVWETRCDSTSGADGGWNTGGFSINHNKMYRFSVWVRRTSSTSSGTFYLGLGDYGTQLKTGDSASAPNPYWDCSGVGVFSQNQWYLVVGHVFPSGTSYTGRHPNTGVYVRGNRQKVRDINGCNIGNDVKWSTSAASTFHRCYHYYSTDASVRMQFFDPRIEPCDGTEPTIEELLEGHSHKWEDRSGNSNHCYWEHVPRFFPNGSRFGDQETTGPYFELNGYSHRGFIKNMQFPNEQTLMMTLRHNYTSGRRNPWNQAYGGYGTWTHEQGNTMSWYFGDAGGNSQPYVGRSSGSTLREKWNILAAARDRSTDQWYNNLDAKTLYSHSYDQLANTSAEITLGHGYAGWYDGQFGPILAYDVRLTESEIAQNYNVIRRYYK